MNEASDQEKNQCELDMDKDAQEVKEQIEKQQKLNDKLDQAKDFSDLNDVEKEISQSDLCDELKKELEEKLEAQNEQMKNELKDKLDKMNEDGFISEEQRDELDKKIEEGKLDELNKLQKEIDAESGLYDQYEEIRESVMPLVDEWYRFFAENLPRKSDIVTDEDSLTRQGSFNRHSVMRLRNLIFGTVKNPRRISPSVEPKFIASIILDVSGSMNGVKLNNARKLLVFYSELFTRISKEFGYIRFSINTFSDNINEIKSFEQDYDSHQRYDFSDGKSQTVKVRLMKNINSQGGTNMLPAIQKSAQDLNQEVYRFPDHASALYFIGDGGDTSGNERNIKNFLELNNAENGFGEHIKSAILIGSEQDKSALSSIFGDENTTVASDLEELIEQSMNKFKEDIELYLSNKTI